ncbi:uncharacterized protein CXQ87_001867 [Candidozyma duobushaemuli]|uniref:Large ribosomal subunit protein uL11m n=1 Tax=Candidozyma duobushaemuli TaxID=1231522 RepID=A0A2V1A6P1_9ASCO|nr:uncharacterized protein CXQ87_001867 [[Candida] duobushaemulonis]PVH13749.1 hypothetical protein CXQ87_001867 [[Candida] duobushaemulonis]
MSAKNVFVKLIVGAGQAAPAPPVGPALGSKGIRPLRSRNPIPILMTIKPNRTFTFEMKSPPTSWLLMKAAKAEKGSGRATHEFVGETLSLKHIYEIAKIKKTDERHKDLSLQQICGGIISTAEAIGVRVEP